MVTSDEPIRALWIAVVAVVLVGTGLRPARATVDLTGTWSVTVDIAGTSTVTLTQTGTTLDWEPGGFSGTIDSSTGAFGLVGTPLPGGILPGPLPYGPSPAPTITGTATPDATTINGTMLVWFVKITPPVDFQHFPWFGLVVSFRGVRDGAAVVCGDGTIEGDEVCDDGAQNGIDDCCSSACRPIDPDQDGVCSALDDCPDVYDPMQDGACGETITVTRAKLWAGSAGRVAMKGTLPEAVAMADLTTIGLTASPGVAALRDLVCSTANARRRRCLGASASLRFRRQASTPDWRFTFTAHGLSLPGSVAGPVAVRLERGLDVLAEGAIAACEASGSRLSCRQ